MRILISTSTFPLACDDGRPRFVYDLARSLARHCRVTVLAPHHPGADLRTEMGGVEIRRFGYAWPPGRQRLAYGSGMPDNLRHDPRARWQVPSYVAALGLALRRLVRRQRIDVVNSHWLVPQALTAALALGRGRRCAHVATAHGGDVMMLERLPGARPIGRVIAGRTEMILTVGEHLTRRLRRLTGEGMACATQPMGVDVRRFAATPARQTARIPFGGHFILFVGRLVPIKGVDILLDAMPALLETDAGLGLVVAGDGTQAPRLQRKARQMGIDGRVRFVGRLGHERLLPYLHACQALALPSVEGPGGQTEGAPTVLAEALAAGCRVVASRTGGAAAVLRDGVNGWLARPGDAGHLARKLRQALTCQGDAVRRAARTTALQWDWAQVADAYMAHFQTALELHRRRDGRS